MSFNNVVLVLSVERQYSCGSIKQQEIISTNTNVPTSSTYVQGKLQEDE